MSAQRADWQNFWERQLDEIEAAGTRRRLNCFAREKKSATEMQSTDRYLINFGSNDYLNLACHPAIIETIQHGVGEYGWGSGASPLVTGRSAVHARLEESLAEFERAEAALLFPTGYSANVAAVVTLMERGDGIFSDQLNHASLIDGCRLSRAEICRYRHVDTADLAEQLAAHRSRFRRAIILTDSLFSMDGDLAPLEEICNLAERFDCLVVTDEAHATGVYGDRGEGWCHEMGCSDRVLVRTGTLSKSLGGLGGFLIGPRALIDLAVHRARGYMFSTSMPVAMALAAHKALDLLSEMKLERVALRQTGRDLRDQLRAEGWNVGGTDSPIIPVYIGDPNRAVALSRQLMDKGCFVPAIRPPTVPQGESLLRISLSTAHRLGHIQQLLKSFHEIRQQSLLSMEKNRASDERYA